MGPFKKRKFSKNLRFCSVGRSKNFFSLRFPSITHNSTESDGWRGHVQTARDWDTTIFQCYRVPKQIQQAALKFHLSYILKYDDYKLCLVIPVLVLLCLEFPDRTVIR